MRGIVFTVVSMFAAGTGLSAQTAADSKSTPSAAVDPHEDPRVNGGDAAGADRIAAPPQPDAKPDPVPVRPPNLAARVPDESPGKALTDSGIQRNIRTALLSDPATAPHVRDIKIISHAGLVTLEGTVASAELRHKIEEKVKGVIGEGKLTDHVEVRDAALKAARQQRKASR
jgi:hypothetical protein